MKALFLASYVPEAARAMQGWLDAGHEIVAVWRPELKQQGTRHRDGRLALYAPHWSSAALTRRETIPVQVVPRLSRWEGRLNAARAIGADVLVSVYFPFVVPQDLLDLYGERAVNLHPAPLPRYRGPSPFYAMLADRAIATDGALTLHVMTAGLDEGAIIAAEPVAFPADHSLMRYRFAVARAAYKLTRESLPAFIDGNVTARGQDASIATYLGFDKIDVAIDSSMSADDICWRCDAIGTNRPVPLRDRPKLKIAGFGRVLGAPTGQPMRLGRFSIDMDCRDARVRLWRKMPWTSPLRKLREGLMHLREPA